MHTRMLMVQAHTYVNRNGTVRNDILGGAGLEVRRPNHVTFIGSINSAFKHL